MYLLDLHAFVNVIILWILQPYFGILIHKLIKKLIKQKKIQRTILILTHKAQHIVDVKTNGQYISIFRF